MRVKAPGLTLGLLVGLAVLSCCRGVNVPPAFIPGSSHGICAGCLLSVEDSLFSLVVTNEAEYEALVHDCFPHHLREEWLPPQPGPSERLAYVSLRGGGCEGCLGIVAVEETPETFVIKAEGGFRGECEKLMLAGAWALIPASDKQVVFSFSEVDCTD
jgi:hypothetical protein